MSHKIGSFRFSDEYCCCFRDLLEAGHISGPFQNLDLSTLTIFGDEFSYLFLHCVIFSVLTLILPSSVHILSLALCSLLSRKNSLTTWYILTKKYHVCKNLYFWIRKCIPLSGTIWAPTTYAQLYLIFFSWISVLYNIACEVRSVLCHILLQTNLEKNILKSSQKYNCNYKTS
jgi:hypothetical protein